MTDLFREVDEEVRRDKFALLWKKYGVALSFGVLVLLVAVGGWRYYVAEQERVSAAAGERFATALEQLRKGNTAEGDAGLAKLAADAPPGYRVLARFRAASELGKRDAAAAVKAFEALATDSAVEPVLQELARLRAGLLLVDGAPYADLRQRLEGMTEATQPWRNAAREALGLSAYKAGEFDAAARWFDFIIIDREAAPAQRNRAQVMQELIRGGQVPTGQGQGQGQGQGASAPKG
jgi:hypothetical protein